MAKDNSNYLLAENNATHQPGTNQTPQVNEHAPAGSGHGGGHGGGDIPPSEVFPTLLKSLGEHRDFSFFHVKLFDLPVIIYDKETGISAYASVEKMEEAKVFTIDHKSHKLVKSKDHMPPSLDLSVTSLVVYQWIAALLLIFVFLKVGARYRKQPTSAPKGLSNLIEAAVIFIRDEVVGPNINGKHIVNRLLPYFVVLFFFILIMNMLGLLPGGHTATGAIGTTAGLAITAFFVINITSIREIGILSYLKHLLGGAPIWLAPIMLPIEILSMFIKPIALTIRLFANMTAGHVVLLSLVGLIFYFKSFAVSPVSVGFSVFMYSLELLVAFLQAYIFTILTAVFTGLGVGEHSHEEGHSHSH